MSMKTEYSTLSEGRSEHTDFHLCCLITGVWVKLKFLQNANTADHWRAMTEAKYENKLLSQVYHL